MTGTIHTREPVWLEMVEDAILAELKAGVSGSVKVEPFPADPETFDFAGLDRAVLVHYAGARFEARNGKPTPNQIQALEFALVLLARDLRGHAGAYQALHDIRLAIQGVPFVGAGPAEIISQELVSEGKGVWRFDTRIRLNAPAVARDRQPPAPLMRPATITP